VKKSLASAAVAAIALAVGPMAQPPAEAATTHTKRVCHKNALGQKDCVRIAYHNVGRVGSQITAVTCDGGSQGFKYLDDDDVCSPFEIYAFNRGKIIGHYKVKKLHAHDFIYIKEGTRRRSGVALIVTYQAHFSFWGDPYRVTQIIARHHR
jgi:hypothetical protein